MVRLNPKWDKNKDDNDSHPEGWLSDGLIEGDSPLAVRINKGMLDAEDKGMFEGCPPVLAMVVRHKAGCPSNEGKEDLSSVSRADMDACTCDNPPIGIIKVLCKCAPILIETDGTARKMTEGELDY